MEIEEFEQEQEELRKLLLEVSCFIPEDTLDRFIYLIESRKTYNDKDLEYVIDHMGE